ncbi:hypothetical protein EMPS_03919 [Entomortierella parvispora]|uniref:TRP C-terminal domain-containing protein n=1 Tax=Entomortierella parvispora TaxID=205924 RepID=A0A9P3H7N0_9FUNG|nr:hypothetical protein EMPS_03919 [Entomortierella parvispora]
MLPRPVSTLSQIVLSFLLATALIPVQIHAGVSSARLQCQYSFLGITNMIQDPSCTLLAQTGTDPPVVAAPPTLPTTPSISTGPLTAGPTAANPWSYTPGWVYNPMFSCCSYSSSATNSTDASLPTLITSVDLSSSAALIDQGQQELELSASFYTSNGPNSTSPSSSTTDTFLVLIRFLDSTGAYMTIDTTGADSTSQAQALRPADVESLLYYEFDAVTLEDVRIPVGARAVVVQILVPAAQTSFCFDYFALRLVQGSNYPTIQSLIQKCLIAVGCLVLVNGIIIPIILFHGLPGWIWRTAPVNFFQKNPVVDHYVPLALFVSTCQWIYNILLQYLGGSSSTVSIIHSSQAMWLIPLVLIGTFFASAFVHWALFLCYNQVMQRPRQRFHAAPRRWRAPLLGLWAALCLFVARIGILALAIIQGGYWSVPIGILLAVPETAAMASVMIFFIKTMWLLIREGRVKDRRGVAHQGISGGNNGGKKGANLSRSDSTTPLWDDAASVMSLDDPQDDLINLSSYHHRAYVKSLLTPENDLRDAAGSMYGRSTIGSDRAPNAAGRSGYGGANSTAGDNSSRYMGSTLNTTISMASSSATEYTRFPTEYDFNVSPETDRRFLSPTAARQGKGVGAQRGRSGAPSEKSTSAPSARTTGGPSTGQRRPPMYKNRPSSTNTNTNINNHKLTWNSATTSYTTTSAALPMTGETPTLSVWEYIVYPKRHIWPTLVGTYWLIARLPLRILVAVLTTLVLCYDVLLSMGAAETVLAVPVSCLLGAMAYPGQGQFDNTMNVARAMHTVNLVLIVVLLPSVVILTVVHQIRMVQKYNWCLRLLRMGNYGFIPGGREYTQHLKHPVRFIGYTVGFGVVGLCFTVVLLFTLCTLVAMLLVAATFRSSIFRTLGSRALAAFGISCLLVLILWIVQMLVIRYRFRMPGSRFLLSSHNASRAGFYHWEFFWAFFNIVFGAFSFSKRIFLSVLSMGIYSTRIDLCIMGGRFRPWDGGYSAFVGLVLADHVLNHPIVLEFVQILRDLLLVRRHPNLAHIYLEARKNESSTSRNGQENEDDIRKRRLMMMMSPQQPHRGGVGARRRALNDIEEAEEARMEDLLMVSGGAAGVGVAIKGGAASPEVSKVHHYFRLDQRADRHGAGQGPLGAALASSSSAAPLSPPPAYGQPNRGVSGLHVQLQDTRTIIGDHSSAVSREQIRQKMSEAKLRSIRIRNRWFLLVTLVRNPSLCSLRRTKAEDFLHPIGQGAEFFDLHGSHEEEALTDIQWDRED